MTAVLGLTNGDVADVFEQVADLLEAQQANPYRVRAYREGARVARSLERDLFELLASGGPKELEQLPGIGKRLAAVIAELGRTGRLKLLERLLGEVSPEDLLATVPGIGDELAHRICSELGVETLEDLELAAHDGRLLGVRGFGDRRVRAVREALGNMLDRTTRRRVLAQRWRERETGQRAPERPSVELLLEIDERYRSAARAGKLRKIAPRRFNPSGQAWLPILHVEAQGWYFTAIYSNTARAHALGKTNDWVVIYAERDGREERATVVTETHGPLAARRVVRSR